MAEIEVIGAVAVVEVVVEVAEAVGAEAVVELVVVEVVE